MYGRLSPKLPPVVTGLVCAVFLFDLILNAY